MRQRPPPAAYVAVALAAAVLVITAQAISLLWHHDGRPLRMLRIGSAYARHAGLSSVEMQDALVDDGFDGQFFFYLARDPLLSASTERAFDSPRLRARRIGFAALGRVLGGRNGAARGLLAAEALAALILVALVQSAAWRAGVSPLWGLAIVISLPFAISLEFVTAELLAAALVVGAGEARWRGHRVVAVALLAAAGLVKEVSVIAPIAFAAVDLRRRQPVAAAVWLSALVPLVAWEAFLISRLGGGTAGQLLLRNLTVPGVGVWQALQAHIATIVDGGQRVKAIGLLVATVWYSVGAFGALVLCVRKQTSTRLLAASAALLALLLRYGGAAPALNEVFNFGRQIFLLPTAAAMVFLQERPENSSLERAVLGAWLACGSALGALWISQELVMGR